MTAPLKPVGPEVRWVGFPEPPEGLTDAQQRVYGGPETPETGYKAFRCYCGHTTGDHQSGGTRWPHPPRYGLCLVDGCDCDEYVEVPKP